jgi:hypothetical protein
VAGTFEKHLQECAKEDSFTLVRCLASRASGEDGKTGSCNQGWGPGAFFLPCHHEIWISEIFYEESYSGRRVSKVPKQGYPQIEAQRDV